MSDINLSILQGRLTRKPELRTTPSGVAVCDLSVASNRQVPRKGAEGQFDEYTTFVKVTLWNKMAERWVKKLDTGDMVIVQGQLVDDNYTKDNVKTAGRMKIDQVTRLNLLPRRPHVAHTDLEEATSDLPTE